MKLTTTVRLLPDDPEGLKAFMRRFNAAADWASGVAFEQRAFPWFSLRKLTYRPVRERFGLSSAEAQTATRKAAYAYRVKVRRARRANIRPLSGVPVWAHSYKRDGTVSFYGMRVPFKARPGVALSGKHEAVLVYRGGKFILQQAVEVPEVEPRPTDDVLGCDLGIVNLLTDSDGETYSGAVVDDKRRMFAHRRRNLQRKGTRSAKRKLVRLSGRQALYQRDTNHKIARRVVTKAQGHSVGIALENLKGIRERITGRRCQRGRLHNWGFAQLGGFVAYKATLVGLRTIYVDPHNSSRTCPACGHVAKKNRRTQADFVCQRCGLAGSADYFAALCIRARARGNEPMAAPVRVAASPQGSSCG